MKPGLVFWLTGLSGSGKSTIANGVKSLLLESNKKIWVLDGDEVRAQYPQKLGFSKADVAMNNTNILNLCLKQRHAYDCLLVPVISPYESTRNEARQKLDGDYYEIFVKASLACVSERDTKGLYQKAKSKEINNLIGVSKESPYQIPTKPHLILQTDNSSEQECIAKLTEFIMSKLNLVTRINER